MTPFEVRIPILAEAGFYSNIKLGVLSLARLGGPYAEAAVSISVGGAAESASVTAANTWANAYRNVAWNLPPPEDTDDPFFAVCDRFARPAIHDVIIMADADVCFLSPFDELLATVQANPKPTVAGVMAHFPPHRFHESSQKNNAFWHDLLSDYGFENLPLDFGYSETDRAVSGGCPPYFNYGFLVMNRLAFEQIAPLARPLIQECFTRFKDTSTAFFSAQLAFTLAVLQVGADVIELGPEYNCPNSDEMLAHGLQSADHIRVLHYLRRKPVDRHHFLSQKTAFEHFKMASFPSTILQRFQNHVLDLPGVFYDEAAAED